MQTIFNDRMDTKKLRQKILDLAIHGKLVPQDPNDEPASVLLERIRAEKKRLIAEGKIKRSKKSATSDTSHYKNEVPFEVPEGWCWTTIGEVSSSILYGVSESAKETGAYKLLRITDIQDNKVDWDSVPYTDFNKDKALNYLLQDGDILFARTGATVGKSYLVSGLTKDSIYASYLIRVQTSQLIFPEYIKRFFESGYYWEQISLSSVGIGQPNVNGTTLANLNVPIPPYKEQLRIVEEANRWLAIADILDENTGHICKAIESAKAKILDLAIHGKLVPQDPNDEPAIELLKRINPKFVPCDNAHYENVPSNWALARVEDIGQLLSGRDLTKDECNSENIGLPYLIGASNIEGNTFSFIRWTEKPQVISQIGDILISCKGTIGAIVKNDIGDIHIARQFMAIRPNTDGITSDYLHICMIAVVEEIKKDARGVIPGIARDDILTKVFAIPPINEQRRIIAAINQYHSILDNISANL